MRIPTPKRFICSGAMPLAIGLLAVLPARATVIFDSFDPGGSFSPTSYVVAVTTVRQGAQVECSRSAARFTVSGGNYSLDSITLPISHASAYQLLRVRVAADAGGSPGATLEVLSENQAWPPLATPFTTATTLLSASHPLLCNGASYWIVTEPTFFPSDHMLTNEYEWFENVGGAPVTFRQQLQSGGLPVDPWTGTNTTVPVALRVDATLLGPATFTWVVASGSWTTPASWTPARSCPAVDDILVFDGSITPSATVTLIPNHETVGELKVINSAQVTFNASTVDTVTIAGGTGEDFSIDAGARLTLTSVPSGNLVALALLSGATGHVSGELRVGPGTNRLLPTDAGSVSFESGSICRTQNGFLGSLFGTTGTSNVVVFKSGSLYEHGGGNQPFGLAAPNSRIVLQSGSLVRYLATSGNGAFAGRTYSNCEYNNGSTTIGGSALPVTFDNLTIMWGGFQNNAFTMNIHGNLTVNTPGFFDPSPATGTATINFNGSSAQALAGTGILTLGPATNLTVANPAGLTLGRYVYSSGTVTLSGGPLYTGLYLLHMGSVNSVIGPKWVVGNLGKIVPVSAGTLTCPFEVGDALRAATVTATFASIADSGTIMARTVSGDHPDIVSSGLDPAQSVNRNWRVQNSGVDFSTCDVTLGFDPADLDAGADPSLFFVGKLDGSTWSLPDIGTRTATSTQAIGLTSFSDFAVAEKAGPAAVDPVMPFATALAPARPMPFRSSTVLEYSLAREGPVELAILDVGGRRIVTLERGDRAAGVHRVEWDGSDGGGRPVAAGIYLARFGTPEAHFDRRLIKLQ